MRSDHHLCQPVGSVVHRGSWMWLPTLDESRLCKPKPWTCRSWAVLVRQGGGRWTETPNGDREREREREGTKLMSSNYADFID